MESKECTKCFVVQSLSCYYKEKANPSGYQNLCKTCNIELSLAYKRTKVGMLTILYNNQVTSVTKGRVSEITYSKQEFIDWCMSQKEFHVLYDNWKRLDYQKAYRPSGDRKDDYLGYTLSNLQLVTWKFNEAKGSSDRKNGINNKVSKAVLQYGIDGVFIKEYHSGREAARNNIATSAGISQCCKGLTKQSGGYIWKYKGEE